MEQPELPQSYYLDNVLILFQHVEKTYADILDSDQVEFLAGFNLLDDDARKLYIRLLNRSHDWFRLSKLHYPEITSVDSAIQHLVEQQFLQLNPTIEVDQLLALFTKTELLNATKTRQPLKSLRRNELEQRLLDNDDENYFNKLLESDDFLKVLQRDQYQLCQMLFFGNLNQSMTDFVLRDLGLYQFENYSIDPLHRPYRNSLEIQQHWLLQQLALLLEQIDLQDNRLLKEIFDLIPQDIEQDAPAFRKADHLRFQVARQLERNSEIGTALKYYRACQLPPARERMARVYNQQDKPQQALEQCIDIIQTPLDESENQFACSFGARLCKRHELPLPESIRRHAITHKPDIIELELDQQDSVEIAVAEHFGEGCHYLENSLFNGVLGLLIWDILYAPVSGAFYNPFQYRPSDLYDHDFLEKRSHLWQQTLNSINNNQDIWQIISACWSQKQGLMNPLVNWPMLDLDIMELALERIEHRHWLAIFDRILRDLRNNRAGFPDLVLFPPEGGYQLIEVKGPGDTLQKNQQRWMQYFKQHDIPHCLARVQWKTS